MTVQSQSKQGEHDRKPTHMCLACGAVGYAGGYHDHGDGNAGDTAPIATVLRLLTEAGEVADERDEAQAALEDIQKERSHGATANSEYIDRRIVEGLGGGRA